MPQLRRKRQRQLFDEAPAAEPFGQGELDLLQFLIPHIQRAVRCAWPAAHRLLMLVAWPTDSEPRSLRWVLAGPWQWGPYQGQSEGSRCGA